MRVLALPEGGASEPHEIEIRRSRFICALGRVSTEDAARDFVAARRRADPGASHHCSAYVLGDWGDITRNNDDGEPGGTAGAPMLEVLTRRELTDVVAVVTRHFGGVKLGAGGLVRAYSRSVAGAVDLVGVVEVIRVAPVRIVVDHARAGRLLAELHHHGHTPGDVRYGTHAEIDLPVPEDQVESFTELVNALTGGHAVVSRT